MFDGKVPQGWQVVRAEDIAQPAKGAIVSGPFGSNIGKRFFVETGVPVIRGNNLTIGERFFIDGGFVYITEEKAFELRNCEALVGDLIFTAAGTLGQVGLIPVNARYPKYIISNKQLRLRVNRQIADPMYLYYWFSTPEMKRYIINQNTGSSVPLITLGTLRKLPINLPPIETQHRIADVLSTYDDLIENNTRRIKLLEQAAHDLYREWFINFRFPGHENVRMLETARGWIPEGWKFARLGDIADMKYGKMPLKEERQESGYPIFSGYGIVGFHSIFHYKDKKITIVARGVGGAGDVVMSPPYAFVTNIAIVLHKLAEGVSVKFLYHRLSDTTLRSLRTGSAQPQITIAELAEYRLLLPSPSVQSDFETMVTPIDNMIENLKQQNNSLRITRDLLLPRLVSGEVDVSELDISGVEQN